MATDQRQEYCEECERPTLHARDILSFEWGCLLAILTSGVFLPFWIIIDCRNRGTPYLCQTCGNALPVGQYQGGCSSTTAAVVLVMCLIAICLLMLFVSLSSP